MKYHSYKEWETLGYIVKKGEHTTKVDDDYENTYLFSEEQVIKPYSVQDTLDEIKEKELNEYNKEIQSAKERIPIIKKSLKENFNIDIEDGNGNYKSLETVLEELTDKWNENIKKEGN